MTRAATRHDDPNPAGAPPGAAASTDRPHDRLDKSARAMSHRAPATGSHYFRRQDGMLDNNISSFEEDRHYRLHGKGGR
jgi:hypothetical protein